HLDRITMRAPPRADRDDRTRKVAESRSDVRSRSCGLGARGARCGGRAARARPRQRSALARRGLLGELRRTSVWRAAGPARRRSHAAALLRAARRLDAAVW